MTPKERLWAAVRGEPLDRVPVAPRIWRYAKSVNRSLIELAQQYDFEVSLCAGSLLTAVHDYFGTRGDQWPEARVEVRAERDGQMTRIERTIRTPGGVLHDALVLPDAGGDYGISPNPEWSEPLVKTRADAELLPYLLPAPDQMKTCFDELLRLEEEVGDMGFLAVRPSIGPDHLAVDSLGVVQALMASAAEPDFLARVVEIADDWHTEVMKVVLEGGFRLIFDSLYNFSLSVGWSPNFYRRVAMPMIKRHADLVHSYGGTLFFYDDGKMAKSVGCMVEAGADIIETLTPAPAGDIIYADLAREHGGKACFKGGIDTAYELGQIAGADRASTRHIDTLRDLVSKLT